MPGLLEKDQVGKREDLADIISLVDVRACPFISMVKKEKRLGNTLMEWQVDSYDDPTTDGVVDGTDVTDFDNAAKNRQKLQARCQTIRKTAKVSGLAEEVSNVAGVKGGEMARAVAKKLVEWKRSMEATCLSDNNNQLDDGNNENLLRGLGKWIIASGDTDLYPVPDVFLPGSAQVETTATASLVEDTHVQGILQAIFDHTGMTGNYKLIAGSTLRRAFTDMTRASANAINDASKVRTFNGDIGDKKITQTTTIYEGDYGQIEILSSSFIGWSAGAPDKDRGYLLDMDKLALRYGRMPVVQKLPDLGGGPRRLIQGDAALVVYNPVGLGKFQP